MTANNFEYSISHSKITPENRKIISSSYSIPSNLFIEKKRNKYPAIDILNMVSVKMYILESFVIFFINTKTVCITIRAFSSIKYT